MHYCHYLTQNSLLKRRRFFFIGVSKLPSSVFIATLNFSQVPEGIKHQLQPFICGIAEFVLSFSLDIIRLYIFIHLKIKICHQFSYFGKPPSPLSDNILSEVYRQRLRNTEMMNNTVRMFMLEGLSRANQAGNDCI